MLLKDVSFQTPQENILFDEVLLHLAEQGQQGEVLRFWESPQYFVVLGRIGKERDDVKLDEIGKDGIPLLRRTSGGGTVLQGKGCLNYSLILSKELDPQIADLHRSYQVILNKVINALKRLGIESKFCPTSDIALTENNKKISGNAQRRSKKFILHHGTILYGFDLGMIEKYLTQPKEIPKYRQGRSHSEFVTNISAEPRDIKDAFKKTFKVDHEENGLNHKELACLRLFLETKEISVDPFASAA
jgi:lipoate-protein ligase A